jgi:hypothetical protein
MDSHCDLFLKKERRGGREGGKKESEESEESLSLPNFVFSSFDKGMWLFPSTITESSCRSTTKRGALHVRNKTDITAV